MEMGVKYHKNTGKGVICALQRAFQREQNTSNGTKVRRLWIYLLFHLLSHQVGTPRGTEGAEDDGEGLGDTSKHCLWALPGKAFNTSSACVRLVRSKGET